MADDDIVVCGIGGRFPGADNVDEFWKLLVNGENHLRDIPKERFDMDPYYDSDPNKPWKSYVRKAALINDAFGWDYRLYGISEHEAQTVDPQQRMVLDCVYMAMEDAGITTTDLDGSNTAVFIGAMNDDFKSTYTTRTKHIDGMSATGIFPTLISARVSYVFNLVGTAATIDTACSSSLVAIHMACQSLKLGEVDAAIAGGVNFMFDPISFVVLSKAKMLSPTGQCHTFTKDADGYARGEGCGIVILKTLKQALKDKNPIWCILKTGTNQDGRMVSPINAPSMEQQIKLLEYIYTHNNIPKDQVQVIEAHGTGTAIGDPTETEALGNFFTSCGKAKRETPLFIGSVKANIGHLESAAGVAGIIKVLLMMKNKTVVPLPMYSKATENPKLNLQQYQMNVPIKLTEWHSTNGVPRMACVNSFGFGGTNAHAILQEYNISPVSLRVEPTPDTKDDVHIITISANDSKSLVENVQAFHKCINKHSHKLNDLSYTSTCRRSHHQKRKAFVVQNETELQRECIAFTGNTLQQERIRTKEKQLIFFFCGIGTSWQGMGQHLLKYPIFKETVSEIDAYLRCLLGWSLIEAWEKGVGIKEPLMNHLSIFSYQVGLLSIWKLWGLVPDVVIGQSVGEVAAAYCAGAFELKCAVNVIIQRSLALQACREGGMIVIRNVPIQTIQSLCFSTYKNLVISGYISQVSCVVSGDKKELYQLKNKVKETPHSLVNELETPCAYHSPYVEEAAERLKSKLENSIDSQPLQVQMISTVTGMDCGHQELGTSQYWSDNVRKPVEQLKAIKALPHLEKSSIFLEIGPSPVLGAHIRDIFDKKDEVTALPSVKKDKELIQMKVALSSLYMQGYDPVWENVVRPGQTLATVPRYSFSKSHTLFQFETKQNKNEHSPHLYITMATSLSGDVTYCIKISKDTTPFVYEHVVHGYVIVPGATYADVGFEIGKSVFGISRIQDLEVSLDFISTVKLPKSKEVELTANISQKGFHHLNFVIMNGQSVVCKGTTLKIKQNTKVKKNVAFDFDKSHSTTYQHQDVYGYLNKLGFDYGDSLKLIQEMSIDRNGNICTGQFDVNGAVGNELKSTHIHACILDATLQMTGVLVRLDEVTDEPSKRKLEIMPIGFGSINICGNFSNTLTVSAVCVNRTNFPTMLKEHYNICIYNDEGDLIVFIENASFFCNLANDKSPDTLKYRLSLEPLHLPMLPQNKNKMTMLIINGKQAFENNHQDENTMIHVNLQSLHSLNIDQIQRAVEESLQKNKCDIACIEAIVYLCESNSASNSVTVDLFESIESQCTLLGHFIEALETLGHRPPTFILTERVYDRNNVSLLGSEVCGYVRSVMQEYMFLEITLVDVSPSIAECNQTLVHLIHSYLSTDDVIPLEVVISKSDVSFLTMTKSKQREIVPNMCINECTADSCVHIETVSDGHQKRHVGIFKPDSTDRAGECDSVYVDLDVKYICKHSIDIYPNIKPGVYENHVLENESNQSVIALEYVGNVREMSKDNSQFEMPENKGKPNSYSEITDHHEAEGERAVIFPAELTHRIMIPVECSIDLRQNPWYSPGILTTGMVVYALANAVPQTETLGIICRSRNNIAVHAFTLLIRDKCRTIKCIDVNSFGEKIQDKMPDTVAILGKLDDSALDSVTNCKEIICLTCSLSQNIKRCLQIVKNVMVTSVDENGIFHAKLIKRNMPNVLKMLQNVYIQKNPDETCSSLLNDKIQNNMPFVHDFLCVPCPTYPMGSGILNKCAHKMMVPRQLMFRKNCIYIVTGGLTGLGWELVKLIAEMGATHIVTFSRRLCSDETVSKLQETESKLSCSITHISVDVTNEKSVNEALVAVETNFPGLPIRGVFHGAGVVRSQLVSGQSDVILADNLQPKVLGAIILHNATEHCSLDYFVLHSSINSMIGSHGQSAYGAANSFMNTFAQWRRQHGFHAIAICWGALAVGMAANEKTRIELEKKGHLLLPVPSLKDCFVHALLNNENVPIYALLDKFTIARDVSQSSMTRFQSRLEFIREEGLYRIDESSDNGITLDLVKYQELNEVGKREYLLTFVFRITQNVFGCIPDELEESTTYAHLGIDSMTALIFISVLFEKTTYRISQNMLYDSKHCLNDTVDLIYAFLKNQ